MTQFECVGVDVYKDKFDLAIKVNNQYKNSTFSNDKKGYHAFAKWLDTIHSPWVCMEATGHYSEGIADFLIEKTIRVSVVNPFQIKSFARARLARNKNDQLDARIIADFCQIMEPRLYSSTSDVQKELKDLTKLLEALKGQLIQLKHQLHSMQNKFAKKTLIRLIKQLARSKQ